jgi:hypothetical protein
VDGVSPAAPGPGGLPADPDGWPTARLDRIARLRALAAALPGAIVNEQVLDAPFDDVWAFIADLERSIPAFDGAVDRAAIDRHDGDHLDMRTWKDPVPIPWRYGVTLRPGWCWMATRPTLHVVGMAAEPDGDRTRYAHMEAIVVSGPAALRAAVRPLLTWSGRVRRGHVDRDVAGIARNVERPPPPPPPADPPAPPAAHPPGPGAAGPAPPGDGG